MLSEAMHNLGYVVGPIVDLTYSSQYDLVKWEVVEWLIWMIQNHRVAAIALEPPCATFSPAAYPPVRSYKVPRGFNQKMPKVWFGNKLAFACLLLIYVAARAEVMGWLETPRRSKMAWLTFWRFLLTLANVEETYTASCSYGSPHQKEFRFLTCNMRPAGICKPCTRDHDHVRIQGKYTKGSAVYCPGLVKALAEMFSKHLDARRQILRSQIIDVSGLESAFVNEVVKRSWWEVSSVWKWHGKSHINVLELASAFQAIKQAARDGGGKVVLLLDSHVAARTIAKGRSSAKALLPLLRKILQ